MTLWNPLAPLSSGAYDEATTGLPPRGRPFAMRVARHEWGLHQVELEGPSMSLHLHRIRFSVRTKNSFLAGTNSKVALYFNIEEDHLNTELEPGLHSIELDHPFHDDFQRGQTDSYELSFGSESSGKERGGTSIPPGIQFSDLEHLRKMHFHIEIDGSDKWILDRYMLAGFIREMRPIADTKDWETIEHGWVELAKHSGEIAMSTDPAEGVARHEIPITAKLSQ